MHRVGGPWCIKGSAVCFPLTTFDTLSYVTTPNVLNLEGRLFVTYRIQYNSQNKPHFADLLSDSYYCTESINTWATELKTELLNREDCNVILVDWPKGAKGPPWNYGQAAGNTRLVGVQTAELIRFLISSTSSGSASSTDRFYIVGFSLGAQVAGYAWSYLQAHGMILGRITGKDILK